MAGVGEPAREEPVAHLIDDLAAGDHRAERDVAGVDPLRDAEDVGDDVPVLAGEPLAGAAEARHHLVEDQQDPVAVADLAHALEVAVGRQDDPVRARDGLEDDRGDRVGALVLEDLLEVRRARADGARIGMAGGAAVGVRVERAHDARHPRLDGPAARIAGQRDGAVRGAVVRAVARDDLVPAGDHAGELDRVLVGLGAAVREERDGEIARRHLGQQPAELGARLARHRRADRAQLVGLILDRLDDLRVLVADVDVDELRREVEVALAVVVPEMPALGTGNGDRVDRVLHRPRVENVLLRVGDDLRAQVRVDVARVRLDRCHRSSSSRSVSMPIVARSGSRWCHRPGNPLTRAKRSTPARGVEYVATAPQSLFGQTFTKTDLAPYVGGAENTNFAWTLHAWIWKPNPSGLFMPWNPSVNCSNA